MGNCGGCAQRAEERARARAEALAAHAGTYQAVSAAAGPLWEAEVDGAVKRFTSPAAARLYIGARQGTVRRIA